jgi:hypothetical protein
MTLRTLLVIALIVVAAPLGAAGPPRLSMQASPSVAVAPANLVVRMTIEADDDNRAIEIIAESDEIYRSSEIPLDGARAPRTNRVEFRDLPGGLYTILAVLKGSHDKTIAVKHGEITVIGSAFER